MSEAIVREIAQQIVREELLWNWSFYLLLFALFLVVSVASAFITSYIRKRAENYATKTDLEELVVQLRATTEAAEQVKTAIAHTDWTTKEWKTLRRIKLEELVETVYAVRQWLDQETEVRLFNKQTTSAPSPVWKLKLVSRLYFPELRDEVQALTLVYGEYTICMIDIQQKLLSAGTDLAQRQVIFDAARNDIMPHHQRLLEITSTIEAKAPEIMKEIVGV